MLKSRLLALPAELRSRILADVAKSYILAAFWAAVPRVPHLLHTCKQIAFKVTRVYIVKLTNMLRFCDAEEARLTHEAYASFARTHYLSKGLEPPIGSYWDWYTAHENGISRLIDQRIALRTMLRRVRSGSTVS